MDIAKRLRIEQELLGDRIQELKKIKQLSQRKLAENSGLSVRLVRRIEKGEANSELRTLSKLAMGFKIRISCLFDYKAQFDIPSAVSIHQDFEKRLASEKKKVGQRISQLCKHRGIDQEELGVLSRIANSDISLYVKGEENMVLLTLLKIAIGLEVEIFDLFNYNGAMPDNKIFKGKNQF
ncbi:MAG: helix-turn-helix transcriptional regulator [Chitinophagaceae bacterium]|nr:helix-turn-helix transcriptional regulator [Chitinophagaceae bacterium]